VKKNTIFILTVVVVQFLLLFVSLGNSDDKKDEWVLYGTTDMGESYYDKSSITEVSTKVIQLWNKDKYSKAGINLIIQGRKNFNLPIDGYDKLDYVTDILELNCVNMTIKDIMFIEYDNQDNVLDEHDILSPKMKHVQQGSIQENLLKLVCPK
jgi:hypothetical protein